MDLSVGGSSAGGGSRSNVHDLEIDNLNAKIGKKAGHNGFEKNLKQDIRYKFQLKKHIAYKVRKSTNKQLRVAYQMRVQPPYNNIM